MAHWCVARVDYFVVHPEHEHVSIEPAECLFKRLEALEIDMADLAELRGVLGRCDVRSSYD